MTTLLDRLDAPTRPRGPDPTGAPADPARRLRATMAAVRVAWTWMGTRRTLTPGQRARAAEAFDAEGAALSAGKKILDTRHPAFRAVTAIRGKADADFRFATLPFPEPGVRLIPHDHVEAFDGRMADHRAELADAVDHLDARFGELRRSAAERLGTLFDPGDYPGSLLGLFGVAWDFPNVEPPAYLLRLSPGLYEAERARVAARFEEAVELAERAFAEEFARLVGHLCGRLEVPADGGEPRTFRDTAVENLSEFFGRFRALNVRSSPELDDLVERARRAVGGSRRGTCEAAGRCGPRWRRTSSGSARPWDGMLVERPRRRILRQAAAPGVA